MTQSELSVKVGSGEYNMDAEGSVSTTSSVLLLGRLSPALKKLFVAGFVHACHHATASCQHHEGTRIQHPASRPGCPTMIESILFVCRAIKHIQLITVLGYCKWAILTNVRSEEQTTLQQTQW
jgi:hypothetical protein